MTEGRFTQDHSGTQSAFGAVVVGLGFGLVEEGQQALLMLDSPLKQGLGRWVVSVHVGQRRHTLMQRLYALCFLR